MENERVYTVYMHTCLKNNKKYIGITRQEPKKDGRMEMDIIGVYSFLMPLKSMVGIILCMKLFYKI